MRTTGQKVSILSFFLIIFGSVLLSACGGDDSGGGDIVASNTQFNTDRLTFGAGEQISLEFVNEDSFEHNWALYESQADAKAKQHPIAIAETVTAGSTTVEFTAPDEGEYPFQCDFHPTMNGTATVQAPRD